MEPVLSESQPPSPDNPSSSRSRGGSEHFRRIGEESLRREHGGHDERFTQLYDELRVRAAALLKHEEAGHTLQPTALVHEAFVRLAQQRKNEVENEGQALALAAIAMRRALVDHARGKAREKRGGGKVQHVDFDANRTMAGDVRVTNPVDVLELDAALEKLAKAEPRQAKVIELRFFGGLTSPQAAGVLGVSLGTVENDWKAARAWLLKELGE